MIDLARITVTLLRAPVSRPMRTAFALLMERPALLIRLEDRDGAVGWGEAYCNFPPGSGEHRLGLLRSIFMPRMEGRRFETPDELYAQLTANTRVLSLQTGELGPFAQCICGIDIAAWDLVSRRKGQTLRDALRADGSTPAEPSVPAYLSGLDPDGPERLAAAGWEQGHRAFKMKLGFGRALDLRNAEAMRRTLGAGVSIAMDVNQVWDEAETLAMVPQLAKFDPAWLEEPLPADTSLAKWQRLARQCPLPLAAGENLRGEAVFDEAIASGAFRVLQPDPVKWGGLTALRRVAAGIVAAGLRFCPHYLGGGLGLVAAAQLTAAIGGPGSMVEVDENENPLRERLACPFPSFAEGRMALPTGPGLGVEPDLAGSRALVVHEWDHRFGGSPP